MRVKEKFFGLVGGEAMLLLAYLAAVAFIISLAYVWMLGGQLHGH
jgi:hypothetical protein